MSKIRRVLKVLNVIIVVLVIVGIYPLIVGISSSRDLSVPVIITTQDQCLKAYNILNEEYEDLTQSEDELRDLIASDFELRLYFYEKIPLEDCAGKVNMITRRIFVDADINNHEFAKVFAHEVIHLKMLTSDERWVCFETFKYLYRHEELHSAGVWYGQLQLQGCWDGEYDIRDLIVDYLTNK